MVISIGFIIVFGLLSDSLCRKIRLPGIIGMILTGIVFGPHVLGMMDPLLVSCADEFRMLAMIIILLRSGLGLYPSSLRKVRKNLLPMALVPCIATATGVTFAAMHLLGTSPVESAMLGTILGAASLVVIVPRALDNIEEGRGESKSISTLLVFSSPIDNVSMVLAFSFVMEIWAGRTGGLNGLAVTVPVSILTGIGIGLAAGRLLCVFFERFTVRSSKKVLCVLGSAIILTWIEKLLKPWLPITSLLGVITMGFVILTQKEAFAYHIATGLRKLWTFAELLLFVLIGVQLDPAELLAILPAGLLVLSVGLLCRMAGVFLALSGSALDYKERFFCSVSWLATVQAAIAAMPLAAGVAAGGKLLAMAVLGVLITAPVAAVGMEFFGRRILKKDSPAPGWFRDLRGKLGLPHVGQRVRDRSTRTVWKIIEEKEVWIEQADKPSIEQPGKIPGIQLRFWYEGASSEPGKGRTDLCVYSELDQSFEDRWEVIYHW